MKKAVSIILAILICVSVCVSVSADVVLSEVLKEESFTDKAGVVLPYRFHVPENYNPEKEYPFILFLHGAGNRGDDNLSPISEHMVMMERIMGGETIVINGRETRLCDEFIIAIPQCAKGEQWVDTPWGTMPDPSYSLDEVKQSKYMTAVLEMIDDIKSKYNVDDNKMYVTGLSMGGFGTWDIIMRYPDMFAAAIPLGGGADLSKAEVIKDIPIWTIHQYLDNLVSSLGTQNMVKELVKVGGNIKFSGYFEYTHNAWKKGYAEKDLFTWLLSQSKDNRPASKESIVKNADEAFKDEIALLYASGLMNDEFAAIYKNNITRLQFCEALAPILPDAENEAEPFEDTDSAAVAKAYKLGIVNGVSETEFAPEKAITREEICTMLARAFRAMKEVIEEPEELSAPDGNAVSDWAKEGVELMAAHKIVVGDENGNINPKNYTTVEEALAVIYRAYYAINTYGVITE